MPRKKGDEATLQAQRAQATRWRYLLRNPDFRNDLKRLSSLQGNIRRTKKFLELRETIADKWGLLWIPGKAILRSFWLEDTQDIPDLEPFGAEWGVDYSPVAVTKLTEDRFLFLRVDLQHPVEDLLPLIEKELREVTQSRTITRRRLDKVDYHLQVFKLVVAGHSFPQIAKTLNRRPSTVKSAFLAASRNIFGAAKIPRKKALALANFDPSTHMKSCPTCQKAKHGKELCTPALLYANQDFKAQRETTGHDTIH